MGSRNRRSAYMSEEQEREASDLEHAVDRLNDGPQSGAYEPGSISEHYTPTAIATPVTAFGQPADIFSHEVLTDDASEHSEDINS
jgi:hypothetical protein